jgi:putative oxidoreductase
MSSMALLITFGLRCVLVLLFLPCSALDKVLNFRGAVGQASEVASAPAVARGLILIGLFVEVVMSLGVVTGIADRLAAFIMAGYCGMTALLWKQFWKPGDFFAGGNSQARGLFWDFLKNFSVAAGFLLITFGPTAEAASAFLAHPILSSHPYRLEAPAP